VSLFLEYFTALRQVFGPNFYSFPRPFAVSAWEVGGIALTNIQAIIFFVTLACLALLQFVVYRTRFGKAMRAVSYDPVTAGLMGVNVDLVISFTFGLGAALAGVGGVLYGIAYPQVNTFMGVMPGLKAFTAAVLGGIGSIPGAVLGALIMGQSETLTSAYLSSTYRDGIAFLILIAVLLVRPTGILGASRTEKV
jgi:branched-chain amino acid transport system permease protein